MHNPPLVSAVGSYGSLADQRISILPLFARHEIAAMDSASELAKLRAKSYANSGEDA
jgi:hypothetical protein